MNKYVKIEWTELRRLLKEEFGFERLGSDNEAWDKYISENYDEV